MSLRRRLFVFVFIPIAVLYYAVGIFGVYQTKSELVEELDVDLASSSARSAELIGPLTTEEITGLIQQTNTEAIRLSVLVDIDADSVFVSPSSREGQVLTPPPAESLTPVALSNRLEQPFTIEASDGSVDYRAVATRIDGGRIVVTAEPLDRIDTLTRRLLVGTVVTGLLIVAAMATVVYVAISSGLRPLGVFMETTVRVAEGDLSERVDVDQDDPAFVELAVATNHMLDQIEYSHATERLGRARLNDLIADAAHELRTPLTAIRGTVEMQSMGVLDTEDRLREAFIGLDDHSKRMAGIVEDLIVIARAENMRLGVQSSTSSIVDLTTLVEARVAAFKYKNPGRQVSVHTSSGEHEVAADDALLRSAIDQILDNVAVHTPLEATVDVQLEGDVDHTRLTISDTGPGIPVEIRGRVFERFVRGDSSRARSTGGAGLGLSIVHSIVEAAGGSVALAPGDKTCVVLTFPRFHRSVAS